MNRKTLTLIISPRPGRRSEIEAQYRGKYLASFLFSEELVSRVAALGNACAWSLAQGFNSIYIYDKSK